MACAIFALLLLLSPAVSTLASEAAISQAAPGADTARRILAVLEGHWKFELTTVSNEAGRQLEGSRVFSPSHNPLALRWEEEIDELDAKISGVLGFDGETNRWYEFALAGTGAGEFTIGAWDEEGGIVFEHRASGDPLSRLRTSLRIMAEDRFEFVRLEEAGGQFREQWRAVFTRVPGTLPD